MTIFKDAKAFQSRFDVSRETLERLKAYDRLLKKWNPTINLVSRKTIPEAWHRHFADSAQLLSHIDGAVSKWLDLGSGAGFPGLVIAVMAQDRVGEVVLVESDVRKSAFLNTVIRELGLSASVKTNRIENMDPQEADVISARALGNLNDLMGFAATHRKKSGICLFLKGQTAQTELTEARQNWHMDVSISPSLTQEEAAILKIGDFSRVDRTD